MNQLKFHFSGKIKIIFHGIQNYEQFPLEYELKNDMNFMFKRTMSAQMVLINVFHQKSQIIFLYILNLERFWALVAVNINKFTVEISTSKCV